MKQKLLACFLWILLASLPAWGQVATDSGASSGSQPDGELIRLIIREIASSQVRQFLFITVRWTVLGGVVGLMLGILPVLLFRKLGWYRSEWRHAKWIRWPVWVISVGFCTGLVGMAGFCKGVVYGTEHLLLKSQLATKVFPALGDAVADGIASVQFYLAETNAARRTKTNLAAALDRFRNDTREINAPQFIRQMDEIQSGAVSNIVAGLESEIASNSAELADGLPRVLLHRSLQLFGSVLVRGKIHSELKRFNVDQFYRTLRERLVHEARQQGHPDTITRQELSTFLVQDAIVPVVMKPIRVYVGGQTKVFLFLALLAAVLPAVLFRLTCGRVKPAPPVGNAPSGSRL